MGSHSSPFEGAVKTRTEMRRMAARLGEASWIIITSRESSARKARSNKLSDSSRLRDDPENLKISLGCPKAICRIRVEATRREKSMERGYLGTPCSPILRNSPATVFSLSFYQGRELKVAGVPLQRQVTVGRDPGNTVSLLDSSVSRRHATFFLQKVGKETRILLRDEGSTNGCEVNGQKVKDKTVQVGLEDFIKIGRFRVQIQEQRSLELPKEIEDSEQTIIYQGPPLCRESLPIDRLKALYHFTTEVSHLDMEQMCELVAKVVAGCLHYDVFCVFLNDELGSPTIRA